MSEQRKLRVNNNRKAKVNLALTFMGCFAIFFFMLCLSMAEGVEGLAAPLGVPSVGGAWPFRTGVLGGKVLSMYSGEM